MGTIRGHVVRHTGSDSVALVAAGYTPLTYERLGRQIRYVGEKLAPEGVAPSDRVALLLPEGAQAAVAVVAVAANAACAPLNPGWPVYELEAQLAALRARVLIVPDGWQSPLLDVAASLNMRILHLLAEPGLVAGPFLAARRGRSAWR
jgi:acyl-CoA synthetase (AMP-forming)/AMP-acid ligase II